MARKSKQELKEIMKQFGVDDIYSWSKYNTYENSIYEYFLRYVKKVKEDRKDGIYGVSGGVSHQILEDYYLNKIKYEDMINAYEDKLFEMNMAELKYNRSDDEKNDNIANKYEDCLKHFFKNHTVIKGKVKIERFITILVGEYLFQGYIDCIHKEDDYFIITDFKTSTAYTGKKIDKEKGQLVLYAEGLRQLGVPLDKIKIRWNFLKYVCVDVEQANENIVTRNIGRNEIGEKLRTNIKMWLKKSGYSEEEIENYLELVVNSNDIEHLPEEVKSKYKIYDCYVYIPLNEEVVEDLKQKIVTTLNEIKEKEEEYKKTKDEMVWDEEITDGQSFYFANLSGYSANLHKPYARYLEKINMFKNEEDNDNEDDLSWLEEI